MEKLNTLKIYLVPFILFLIGIFFFDYLAPKPKTCTIDIEKVIEKPVLIGARFEECKDNGGEYKIFKGYYGYREICSLPQKDLFNVDYSE